MCVSVCERDFLGCVCMCFVLFYLGPVYVFIIGCVLVCVCVCACILSLCLSSKMMDVCGEAESRLASELMQHEVTLERDVLEPVNQLTEVQTHH